MHASRTYTIYWFPSGYTLDASYKNTIDQYLTDVAAASGHTDNVYSAATQYYDTNGPISYNSSFGGAYIDANNFPANGCDDKFHGVSDPVCLTDVQLQAEIQNVLTANGWHGSDTSMFFLMTPNGVGSCFDSRSPSAGGDCTTNSYCAYHSAFTDSNSEPVIYANEPYDATISGCSSGESPNANDADQTINTISHEHNEAITDPFGDAWYSDANGEENGDLCAWTFGTPIGGTAGAQYNQVINGDHYWLQQEYSNDGSTCLQHYLGIPVNFGAPTVSGTAGQGQTLSATSGTWSQSPTSYTYQWLRCSSTSQVSCSAVSGDTGSTYLLTAADAGKIVRVDVYANNASGTSNPAVSAPTAVVVSVPAATSLPVVSGSAAVGKTLSTTPGEWNTTAAFTYQWQRCGANGSACAAISAATSTTYAVVAVDAGHELKVQVTATNVAGTASVSSAATSAIAAVPKSTSMPRISGKPKVGKRLSAGRGTWSGLPQSYRYQWLRCNSRGGACRRISHATHSTYRLAKTDTGHRLRVRISAINAAGTGTASSKATAKVPAARRHS